MKTILLITTLFMFGCTSSQAIRDGGGGYLTSTTTITENLPDGTVTVTENTTTVKLEQPENPESGGSMVVKKNSDGSIEASVSTSATLDTDSSIANIMSLKPVTFSGIGLILIGGLVGIFSKGKYLKESIILGTIGVGLITLAYLLPTYSMIFMLSGIVIVLGIVGYFVWKSVRNYNAVEDNVSLISKIKNKINKNDFKEIAKETQSKSTSKIVNKIRMKNG